MSDLKTLNMATKNQPMMTWKTEKVVANNGIESPPGMMGLSGGNWGYLRYLHSCQT